MPQTVRLSGGTAMKKSRYGIGFICVFIIFCSANLAAQTDASSLEQARQAADRATDELFQFTGTPEQSQSQTETSSNGKTQQAADSRTDELLQPTGTPGQSQISSNTLPDEETAESVEIFRGFSKRLSNLKDAINDAEKDAKTRVSGYIFYQVEEKVVDAFTYKTSMGQVVENTETAAFASSSYTSAVLSGVKTIGEPQVVRYPDGTVEVQVEVAVDKKLLEKAIDDFNRLRDAARTVRFTVDKTEYTARKGARIYVSVGISANTVIDIGLIECVLTYDNVSVPQYVSVGETVVFTIDTTQLSIGIHTVELELQMQKLSPGVKNMNQIVVFEVTPKVTMKDFLSDNTRLFSIGASIGSSFTAPWVIGTAQATFSVLKNTFMDIGCDFGFIHGYEGWEDIYYHSLYPFAHLNVFVPFGGYGGWYAGLGGGYMMAFYTGSGEDSASYVPAFDAATGLYIGKNHHYFTLTYTFRTRITFEFEAVNHKVAVGYSFRFR
jgi:hypothetical protein